MRRLRKVQKAVPRSWKIHGGTSRIGPEAGRQTTHGLRQVARDALPRLVRPAAEQHHDRQRIAPTCKEVYQDPLMIPVDLSQVAFDLVARDRRTGTPGSEADLQWHRRLHLAPHHDPIQQPHATESDRTDIGPAAVEEGPYQALVPEAIASGKTKTVRARRSLARAGRFRCAHLDDGITCRCAYR